MENSTKISYIETIAKHGHITKAANELFISQPYLSKILQNLEKEVGISIFDRNQKFIRLTFGGERYLAYLKKLNELEKDMQREMELISHNKKGKITFGINSSLGTTILPRILPKFSEQFPGIQIELVEKNAAQLEKLIEDNEVDLGFAMTPIANPNLSYEYLYDDFMHLVVSEKSVLYNRELTGIHEFPYDLDVLTTEPMVMLSRELGMRRLLDEFYELNHLKQNTIIATNTIYTAVSLTKSGLGSTFVPITGMNFSDFSHCNIFKFNKNVLKSTFVLAYKKNRSMTPALLSFFDIIKQEFTQK